MSVPVPACRCGFLPCTADPDAAIEALWQHIEEAHGESVTDPRAAEIGVCLACAKDEHPRCSGSVSLPCHCLHPSHVGAAMRTVDSAIRCPICGHRSTSKVEAFDHERPHLERVAALVMDCRDWFDNPEGEPTSSDLLDRINEALR